MTLTFNKMKQIQQEVVLGTALPVVLKDSTEEAAFRANIHSDLKAAIKNGNELMTPQDWDDSDPEDMSLAYCPTGPGGGIDPTCSPANKKFKNPVPAFKYGPVHEDYKPDGTLTVNQWYLQGHQILAVKALVAMTPEQFADRVASIKQIKAFTPKQHEQIIQRTLDAASKRKDAADAAALAVVQSKTAGAAHGITYTKTAEGKLVKNIGNQQVAEQKKVQHGVDLDAQYTAVKPRLESIVAQATSQKGKVSEAEFAALEKKYVVAQNSYQASYSTQSSKDLQTAREALNTAKQNVALTIPQHYQAFDEQINPKHMGSSTPEQISKADAQNVQDYKRSQSIAQHIQRVRTREIAAERGLPNPLPHAVSQVWSNWKGSSTSTGGKALQLACVDELGAQGKSAYGTTLGRKRIISAYGAANYEYLKAHVRGTWESSQYVLEKAGFTEKVKLFRAVHIDNNKLGKQVSQVLETFGPVQGPHGPKVMEPSTQHKESFTELPELKHKRNGAASASSKRSVCNVWNYGSRPGKTRVVLRIEASPKSLLSLPVHGVNVTHESETIIAGTHWKGWDAWLGRAPE